MTEPTTSNFPTSLDSTTSLGGDAVNLIQLTLDAGIDASTTTVSVAEDISAINVPCYILCGTELIYATAKSSGNFTSCDRGAGGTSAATHANGATAYVVYAANLFNQLKRAIIATQTALGISSASVIQTGKLDFPTSTELTIATGSITPTQNWHTVDTESNAASDDLDTIVASGVTDGYVLYLRADNTARTVVVKHNTGNIVTWNAADVTLDETYKSVQLIYDATLSKWICSVIPTTTTLTYRKSATIANPNGYYTNVRAQIPIFRADAALTITRIHLHGADTTPTSELAGDLKFADDLNTGGFANATVIDVCDTTSGVFTATSSFDDATVPSGKYVYFQLDAAPHTDWKDLYIEVYYTYD